MKEKIFELFLSECGTQKKAAKVLKISQSYFNKMRSGERTICPNKAKEITKYLYIKSNKNFSPEQLISSTEKKIS